MRLTTRQREGLTQAAKMAVAATIAWVLARQVHAPQSFMAPYAAVFLVAETVYRSLTEAARLVVTLTLGVVLAFVAITVIPDAVFALPVAVFVGAAVGRWHRLGDSGIWIAITALLMLAGGTAGDAGYLGFRVLEGLLGALVGLAVNMLVFPPLHLRDGRHAVADVGAELSDLIRTIAAGLREDWGPDDARSWRRRARALETAVRRAEDAQSRGHESTRFNPRWALLRRRHDLPEQRLGTLYEVSRQVQHMTEALVAAGDGAAPGFSRSFADLLDTLAAAVRDGERGSGPAGERDAVADSRDRGRRRRKALARHGYGTEGSDGDWSTEAALLLSVERACDAILVE